jgi:hypothetical protein
MGSAFGRYLINQNYPQDAIIRRINAVKVAPLAREKHRLGSLTSGSLTFDDDLDRKVRRIQEDGSNCEKIFF